MPFLHLKVHIIFSLDKQSFGVYTERISLH